MADNKYLALSLDELNNIDKTELSDKALSLLNEAIAAKKEKNDKRLIPDSMITSLLSKGILSEPRLPFTSEQLGTYTLKINSFVLSKGRNPRPLLLGELSPIIDGRDTTKPYGGITCSNLTILKKLNTDSTITFEVVEQEINGVLRCFATNFEIVE